MRSEWRERLGRQASVKVTEGSHRREERRGGSLSRRQRMEEGFSSYSSLYDTSSLLQFCNGKTNSPLLPHRVSLASLHALSLDLTCHQLSGCINLTPSRLVCAKCVFLYAHTSFWLLEYDQFGSAGKRCTKPSRELINKEPSLCISLMRPVC